MPRMRRRAAKGLVGVEMAPISRILNLLSLPFIMHTSFHSIIKLGGKTLIVLWRKIMRLCRASEGLLERASLHWAVQQTDRRDGAELRSTSRAGGWVPVCFLASATLDDLNDRYIHGEECSLSKFQRLATLTCKVPFCGTWPGVPAGKHKTG